MAQLILQYKESSDEDISTYQRAVNLSAKKSLLANEIVELQGSQRSYALQPSLLGDVTQVVGELQIFLERTSALIPERSSYFKVDPRDTFLSILRQSSDIGQLHAAWMGLSRRLALAQENLEKYEMQYHSPLAGENIVMPTSPVSTDVGIYEAMEDLDDKDLQLRYLYDNVPHHQDQIKSPRKLRNGAPWSNILSLPSNLPENSQSRLPTIVKYSLDDQESQEISQVKRGKRRITDEFISPPASPRVLNVGYGTPFKSSSQFFTRPGGVPLPPTETISQRNVLVGLGLPHTPAFENIPNTREAPQASKSATQVRSQASNPFEGRPLPPHMAEDTRESREDLGQATSTPINQQNTNFIDNQRQRPTETKSDGGSSHHRSSNGNQRGGNRGNPAGGDPDGSDDDDDGDEYPRGNNRNN